MLLPRRIHVRGTIEEKKDFLARYYHGGMNVSLCLGVSSQQHYRGFSTTVFVSGSRSLVLLFVVVSLFLFLSLCLSLSFVSFVSPVPRVCLFRRVPFVVDCRQNSVFPNGPTYVSNFPKQVSWCLQIKPKEFTTLYLFFAKTK